MSHPAASILAERLRRNGLTAPVATPDAWLDLFARLQPVAPVHNTRPGEPPRLIHRTRRDDRPLANRYRAERTVIKGRFLGGGIGYVLARDLALYATAFVRPLALPTDVQQRVLEAVQATGPLTPRQIKEETGLLNKQIMPALHRLQEAYLVYEDQVDEDWERGWYDFAAEWPDVALDLADQPAARAEVLRRCLAAHVFLTTEQLQDWSRLPARAVVAALADLEQSRTIAATRVPGLGDGWRLAGEPPLPAAGPPPSVFMLHLADPLVRTHASALKRQFAGLEVLQYLLIDGVFQGAVTGHWRIGPHDVEDIALTLPAAERAGRRDAILAAVAATYHPPHARIRSYDGQPLDG